MSNTNKEYRRAFDTWVKQQNNTIRQIEYNIENSKRMVEVHTEALELQKKSLKYETELLHKALEVDKLDNE